MDVKSNGVMDEKFGDESFTKNDFSNVIFIILNFPCLVTLRIYWSDRLGNKEERVFEVLLSSLLFEGREIFKFKMAGLNLCRV